MYLLWLMEMVNEYFQRTNTMDIFLFHKAFKFESVPFLIFNFYLMLCITFNTKSCQYLDLLPLVPVFLKCFAAAIQKSGCICFLIS